MSRNKHLTKLYKKCPLHLKYVLALPWEIWSERLTSSQRSTYMYILMNQWIATTGVAVIVSKNRQRVSKSHHLYIYARNVCLPHECKHVDVGAMHVANCMSNEQRCWDCSLVLDASFQLKFAGIWDTGTRWRRTFRTCSVRYNLLHVWRFMRQWLQPCLWQAIQWLIKMHM